MTSQETSTSDQATSSLEAKPSSFYQERNASGYVGVSLRGVLMGGADVIPGVSGGTMALIVGIYRELVASIKAFDITAIRLLLKGQVRDFSRHVNLPFLLALGMGILVAIGSLSKVLPKLLFTYPAPTKGFFFGLILASIYLVWQQIERHDVATGIMVLLGAVGAYYFVGLIPVQTPEHLGFIFLCGFIAICAMILPGISGAFLLLLLGKYAFILEALSNVIRHRKIDHNFLVVVVFAAGCACGLLAFSRFLNWLLDRFHAPTLAALTGLMIGSLRKIWPYQTGTPNFQTVTELTNEFFWPYREEILFNLNKKGMYMQNHWPSQWNSQYVLAAVLVVAGVMCVLTLDYVAKRRNPSEG